LFVGVGVVVGGCVVVGGGVGGFLCVRERATWAASADSCRQRSFVCACVCWRESVCVCMRERECVCVCVRVHV